MIEIVLDPIGLVVLENLVGCVLRHRELVLGLVVNELREAPVLDALSVD